MMQNIKDYYDSYSSYYDLIGQQQSTMRENVANNLGVIGNVGQITRLQNAESDAIIKQQNNLRVSAETMKQQLAQLVNSGIIQENSKEFMEWKNSII